MNQMELTEEDIKSIGNGRWYLQHKQKFWIFYIGIVILFVLGHLVMGYLTPILEDDHKYYYDTPEGLVTFTTGDNILILDGEEYQSAVSVSHSPMTTEEWIYFFWIWVVIIASFIGIYFALERPQRRFTKQFKEQWRPVEQTALV